MSAMLRLLFVLSVIMLLLLAVMTSAMDDSDDDDVDDDVDDDIELPEGEYEGDPPAHWVESRPGVFVDPTAVDDDERDYFEGYSDAELATDGEELIPEDEQSIHGEYGVYETDDVDEAPPAEQDEEDQGQDEEDQGQDQDGSEDDD